MGKQCQTLYFWAPKLLQIVSAAMKFQWSCMDVRVGLWRKLAPKNWCFWTVVLQKTLESPLHCKEIQPVHSKGDRSLVFIGRTDAEAETPILWPPYVKNWLIGRPWCWERLTAGEGGCRGWDGWMASPTLWTCVWVNSGSWWWTGRPGVLQRAGHDWATELNWTELNWNVFVLCSTAEIDTIG